MTDETFYIPTNGTDHVRVMVDVFWGVSPREKSTWLVRLGLRNGNNDHMMVDDVWHAARCSQSLREQVDALQGTHSAYGYDRRLAVMANAAAEGLRELTADLYKTMFDHQPATLDEFEREMRVQMTLTAHSLPGVEVRREWSHERRVEVKTTPKATELKAVG